MHGTRCYGCGGSGKKLTKRGAAARAFYVASQDMPLSELKVGMYIWDDVMKVGKFMPVLSIGPCGSYSITKDAEGNEVRTQYVEVKTARGGLGLFPSSTVRAVADEATRRSQLAAALEYQASLGVNGKPLKKAKAAA